MPRKKKLETVESLELKFTGKATLLVELENYGPIEWRIDDKDVLLEMLMIMLDNMGHTSTVNSYDKRTEKTFKRLLDF